MKKGLFYLGIFGAVLASAEMTIDDISGLRKDYNLSAYDSAPVDQVKMAVIDGDFSGAIVPSIVDKQMVFSVNTNVLPGNAKAVADFSKEVPGCSFDPQPYTSQLNAKTSTTSLGHGAIMAMGVKAMAGNTSMFLLPASSYSEVICAIRYARWAKVRVIVISQDYQYLSEFKGDGFINAEINKATAEGIIVIAAAGNDRGQIYNGPVEDQITLRLKNHADGSKIGIRVSWPGTGNDPGIGTDNDLDFEILDPKGVAVEGIENVKQVVKATPEPELPEGTPAPPAPGLGPIDKRAEALHPYETVDGIILDKRNVENDADDVYKLRIFKRSGAFNEGDNVRVTLQYQGNVSGIASTGSFQNSKGKTVFPVELVEATEGKELGTIASNPYVITVGSTATFSSRGPTMAGVEKPEVIMPRSWVKFSSSRTSHEGESSLAAALLGGIVVKLLATQPSLTRADVLKFVETTKATSEFVKVPAMSYLPRDTQYTDITQIKEICPFATEIQEVLKAKSPDMPVVPYIADGRIILGVDDYQTYLKTVYALFPDEAQQANGPRRLQSSHVYLSARYIEKDKRNRVFGVYRLKDQYLGQELSAKDPWEFYEGFAKTDFVEIRYVPFENQRVQRDPVKNVWKTPTPELLKQTISNRLLR